jgi:hypothetical protein
MYVVYDPSRSLLQQEHDTEAIALSGTLFLLSICGVYSPKMLSQGV